MFKLDCHSHTRGSDGTSSPEDIAQAAFAAGLDGLCLTDHHTNTPEDNAEVYRVAEAVEALGLKAFIGVEYSTAQGHLLIFGIDVPNGAWGMYPQMQEVIDDVNALGGACVAAHPYKGYRYSLQDRVKGITGLAAIEGINGQCEVRRDGNNEKAQDAAVEMGLPCTAGSDAHWAANVGIVYTVFPTVIEDDAGLVAALHGGDFRPMRGTRLAGAQAARAVRINAPRPLPALEDPFDEKATAARTYGLAAGPYFDSLAHH